MSEQDFVEYEEFTLPTQLFVSGGADADRSISRIDYLLDFLGMDSTEANAALLMVRVQNVPGDLTVAEVLPQYVWLREESISVGVIQSILARDSETMVLHEVIKFVPRANKIRARREAMAE